MWSRAGALGAGMAFALALAFNPAAALEYKETESLGRTHDAAALPPVAERLPREPLVVDLQAQGREIGKHGGDLETLIGRAKDARLINVWGYARLVGYDGKLNLVPDILESVEVEDDRVFTLHLREGHKWSDGEPFTSEDIRYWWDDIVNEPSLTPSGPDPFMLVDGKPPTFEVIDETTVRFSWDGPNPLFLPTLAAARDPFIYRPAHYLRQFHTRYGDEAKIQELVDKYRASSWAAVHNGMDEMYDATNPDLPTLQPWVLESDGDGQRFVMVRNPYYHRVDTAGQQLPYIDRIVMSVADGRLVATKTQAGESDLQARGLSLSDATVLKRGEADQHYKTLLWPLSYASQVALYPNLTVKDPEWRKLLRDARFRHALSLAINRDHINRAIYLGLGKPGNNTVLPESPLFEEKFRIEHATLDIEGANKRLDDLGLAKRNAEGIRLMPSGRPLEIIVETAGESQEQLDVLELIAGDWKKIGIALYAKPSQRDVIFNRALSGDLVMGVWSGWDNGIATADMAPDELAPVHGDSSLLWPAWGDYWESKAASGEPVDYPPAQELLDLYKRWLSSGSDAERREIWKKMLEIHARETLIIGIVNGVRQPVVVSDHVRNVPVDAFYGWDPGAQFGIWRMDEFFMTN
ncbi:ABC transporter substrate-binding protein [Microbaculum marinum]|uniref:ABC transporter substrate-binding protein n=1 Tax=Microbaculum marinum TaxID=1764581 RepID=A0AAW9RRJ5_9HYPH